MLVLRIIMVALGAVALVLAAVWRPVVAPALTKLPTSLDQNVYFTGTYTGYVNQSTGAALAAPQQVPLSVSRHISAVPAESTSSVLVVNDASALTIGPAKSAAVLQYALDRSTEVNVASPDAYALSPANPVDRAGTYSLGPPPGANPYRSYPFWTDEIGRAVPMTSEPGSTTVAGVTADRWQYALAATPIIPAMVAALKLPAALPFTAFAAEAKAGGFDLAGALRALAPALTPAQRAALASLAAAPIPLRYFYATRAQLLVEPVTGVTVDVVNVVNVVRAYSVRPDLSRLAAGLTPILAAHRSDPAAARLIAAAGELAGAPARPLYTLTFHQTPASAAATARTAGHDAKLLGIVRVWIPVILGVLGLILVVLGLILIRRSRSSAGTLVPAAAGTQEAIT